MIGCFTVKKRVSASYRRWLKTYGSKKIEAVKNATKTQLSDHLKRAYYGGYAAGFEDGVHRGKAEMMLP